MTSTPYADRPVDLPATSVSGPTALPLRRVSWGAIVAGMVIAVGVQLVLSLLGVIGTLVSDLLLLWLDPRIRMGGGSK